MTSFVFALTIQLIVTDNDAFRCWMIIPLSDGVTQRP